MKHDDETKPELSIVIPVYNEEDNVSLLHRSLKEVLDKLNMGYEMIYVDDGSTDNTPKNLKSLRQKDKDVKVIIFRRNFGQTAAMDAGFKSALGRIIIAMDADLQNDPKDIPALLEKINEGYDCVSGWRADRKDPFSKRAFSKIAGIIRNVIARDGIHDLYGEMHRFIPALLKIQGFKITEIKVKHNPRLHGKSKYNILRVLKGFLDLLVVKFWMAYSTRPIHLFGGAVLLIFFVGFIGGVYLSVLKFLYNASIGSRPLLILSALCMMIGFQFFMFGLLADIMVKDYYKEKKPYSTKEILK